MSLNNQTYPRPSMLGPTTPHSASTSQPPSRFLPSHVLTARIAEKQAEYESLSQLRDLSATLATQLENLEAKLSCLADGTESVADVLANWQNVFRAINLATAKLSSLGTQEERTLPEMLVRIPVNDAKPEDADKPL